MKVYIGPYPKEDEDRKINVKIHEYDTWSMDNTLAHIIHPMLVQLKETKHGSPKVDNEDVPAELRSTNAEPVENEWDTDSLWFDRWDWVLDQMIWSFSQKLIDWEEQYHTGEIDFSFIPCDTQGNECAKEDVKLYRLDKGPNNTHVFNKEEYLKHSERMENGFRLFGKYYQALWD